MPIRPENRDRYPVNWGAISLNIRNRSGGRCECKGECRTGHAPKRCRAWNGQPHPRTGSTVVLTVAHLDHTPENCDPENLRAFCQSCHLSYDADEHARTRARTQQAAATAGMEPLWGDA